MRSHHENGIKLSFDDTYDYRTDNHSTFTRSTTSNSHATPAKLHNFHTAFPDVPFTESTNAKTNTHATGNKGFSHTNVKADDMREYPNPITLDFKTQ